jgi:pyrroline-5-carboxylate reductase
LKQSFPIVEIKRSIDETITTADFIFIALHPPAVVDAIKAIIPILREKITIVSLAPKIKTERIHHLIGRKNPVIRMIPNAPSLVNKGYNPVTFGPGCPDQVKKPSLPSSPRSAPCLKSQKKPLKHMQSSPL